MNKTDDFTILEPEPPQFGTSPLYKDPYIWDQCTITIEYMLRPDRVVVVSIRNHWDEPIEKAFDAPEVPLSSQVGNLLADVHKENPDEITYLSIVLLPKPPNQDERSVTISAWTDLTAPKVTCTTESNLSLPEPINTMLTELKILVPARGGMQIDGSCTSGRELTIYSPKHWERSIMTSQASRWIIRITQVLAKLVMGLRALFHCNH